MLVDEETLRKDVIERAAEGRYSLKVKTLMARFGGVAAPAYKPRPARRREGPNALNM